MQDNFDLKGYLRRGNKLLNENLGGYINLTPINELEGQKPPFGMPETDQENPWMEEVDGTDAYSMGLWKCYYDYPGILVWSYDDVPFDQLVVYATPGWDADGTTPVQVDVDGVTKDMTEVDGSRFASFQEYAQAMKVVLDAVEEEYVTKQGVKEKEDLGGWDGDGKHNQYDGEYDGHAGPAITSELEKPEKIYQDDEEDDSANMSNIDMMYSLFELQLQKLVHEIIDEGFEPDDAAQFLRDYADHLDKGGF
jgi:hypothetical protein